MYAAGDADLAAGSSTPWFNRLETDLRRVADGNTGAARNTLEAFEVEVGTLA